MLSTAPFASPDRPVARPGQPAPPPVETPDPRRYSLCREPVCWVLVFQGREAYLSYEIGLCYVSHLLQHPNQTVSAARLFVKFHPPSPGASGITELGLSDASEAIELSDDAIPGEENLDKDTERVLEAHREKAQKCRDMLRDPDASPSGKQLAREQLQQITRFLATQKSSAQDSSTQAGKRVRKSIQRLCDHLREPMPGEKAPNPEALAFADYVEEHILVPSRRYTLAKKGANVHFARGELAGQLSFECPSDHRWSIRP